jgi:hypothetical protein
MVEAIAAAYQVPADLPALLALGCLSAAVAGKSRVRVGPDWKEELCAYVGCLLPSGERKSPVVREIAAPLEAWERAALANERERVIALEQERVIVEKRLAYARERAARESGVERLSAEKEVHDLAFQLERLDQPVVSRLLADDATPEALVSLLADHGGRIAVISAEGGLFDILAGRYSNGAPNLDAVLKAYGCESIRVDRKGRQPERVPRPALALAFAIQPAVLESIASRPDLRGRGLLARFWYAVPSSALGRRRLDPPPVAPEVRLAYEFRLIELLEGVAQSAQSAEPSSSGSDCADLADSAGAEGPVELVLDDRAREILWEFRRRLEPRLNPNTGDLYGASDWAGKLEGSCVRIAGLLHFYEHGWSVGLSTAIEAERMIAAVAIADYLVPHALIALGLTGPRSTSATHARAVLRWIRREERTQFKASDVLDAVSRSVVPDMSTVDASLTLLEDLRYVRRRVQQKTGRPGRPPSPTYDVNPLLDAPR